MKQSVNDFKETLLLPETEFEMKANLVSKEKTFRQHWQEIDLYGKVLAASKHKPRFILHDGPPYANGSLHVGHAINKILKDIVVRYKFMSGYHAPFVPGWDTHGLPIENKMLTEAGVNHKVLDKETLRKKAHEYAISQVKSQTEQFKAMNLLTDFKEIYLTLSPDYEAAQLSVFKKMYFDGLVYKGLKPVFWSPTSQSALAEAEVEYETITSPQVLVAMQDAGDANLAYVIMTTTPWTLIANAAIAVSPEAPYAFVEHAHKTYVIAEALVPSVAKLLKWNEPKITKTLLGKDLVKKAFYFHPLTQEKFPLVLGDHVTLDLGTGLVHTAPLFGEDDFVIGKKHNLKMVMHVNDDGTFNDEGGSYAGMFYLDANKAIGEALKAAGSLLSLTFIKHQYPHDWRTHKPVIFRGTPQWFVSIDKIRPQILKALKSIKSYPDWGTSRMVKMIESRSDWTISRQRTWGVPIIIFYDENGNEVRQPEVFDYVIAAVKEHGSDIWFSWDVDKLLPKQFRHRNWTKEESIVDVWFDSGCSSIAVKPNGIEGPFALYLEGNDQYRGWFNSSLINSVAYRGVAPYQMLVSHGFVLDGNMEKMSKSKGNVINPFDIINKHGADILRLWVANAEYTADVTLSEAIIVQTAEMYRNIRTKLRFLLGNLTRYEVPVRAPHLSGYDAYVASQIKNLQHSVLENYEAYKFMLGVKEINNFITELSSFYLDYTKDTLYADKKHDHKREAVLYNLYTAAHTIIMLLAPVLVTTMEEAYGFLPNSKKAPSVHLELFDFGKKADHPELALKWKPFFVLKDEIYHHVEIAKKANTVSRSQQVAFNVKPSIFNALLEKHHLTWDKALLNEALADMLMIGELTFDESKAHGIYQWSNAKCERCWKHFPKGAMHSDELCQRCFKVVND